MFAKLEFSRKLKDEKNEIDVCSKTFSIGRAESCNIEIADKYLSGHHCTLEFCDDGKVYLTDTSSNGTFINEKRVKNKRIEVAFGSVVYLVKKPNEPDKNLYFTLKFPDLDEKINETVVYSPSETQVIDNQQQNKDDNVEEANKLTEDKDKETLDVEFLSETYEPPAMKKPRLVRVSGVSNEIESSVNVKSCKLDTKPKRTSSPKPAQQPSTSKPEDTMAETLMCSICCEIIHDCISLQPCTHCFCAACYSDWMPRSRHCPECRVKVERIAKNHRINNLIEAYLNEHPDKRRSDDEIKELDAKNKISRDMIYPKKQKNVNAANAEDDSGDESSSYYSSTDVEDDNDQNVSAVLNFNPVAPHVFPFYHPAVPPPLQIAQPRCIQCPTYGRPPVVGILRPAARNPPNFVCGPLQNHVICLCCHNSMPDRRQDRTCPVAMECLICKRPYCNLYFGCTGFGCNGCLNKFKEMNFGNMVLTSIINENHYESQILTNYLNGKNQTWADLLKECLTKMDSGEYSCRDKFAHQLTSETVVCLQCALNNFRDLAYDYRSNIPKDDLPKNVTSRPDCWYGRNCRTQKNNLAHATKLNHICNQTRY